jgi:hypothetical protein
MSASGQRLARTWRTWVLPAAAALGAVLTIVLPLPRELDTAPVRTIGAAATAAIVLVVALGVVLLPSPRRRLGWSLVAVAALVAGIAAFGAANDAGRDCTARYVGHTVVAGTELTPLARDELAERPGQTRDELLFDATGRAEHVWTRQSIDRCRARLAATWFLPVPLLVLCLVAAAQALPGTVRPPIAPPGAKASARDTAMPSGDILYDVFVSYRHEGPDQTFARDLLASLEADGYRVAIDERDFQVNESFLVEMERCIRQSRFTVAIVSERYLQSGNCEEEAIICRILDMGERRRRLIPIFIDRVAAPVWLHGIVGIDATGPDPLVDPLDRLKATLGARI